LKEITSLEEREERVRGRERGEKVDVVSKDTEIVGLDHFVGRKTAAHKNMSQSRETHPTTDRQGFLTLFSLWNFMLSLFKALK